MWMVWFLSALVGFCWLCHSRRGARGASKQIEEEILIWFALLLFH
jgi:hypothetical protein